MPESIIDDLDKTSKELAKSLVADVQAMRREIPHPALSRKLTGRELWELYGAEYPLLREDEDAWKQTIDQMGEKAAVEFGHAMEKALMKHFGGE